MCIFRYIHLEFLNKHEMSEEGDRPYLGGQSPGFLEGQVLWWGQAPHWVGSRWVELRQSGIGYGDERWIFRNRAGLLPSRCSHVRE